VPGRRNAAKNLREPLKLPSRYYGEVFDFVAYIKEKKVKKAISLEKAADLAVEEYRNDTELTTFCSLDGEDFL
jgi:hypothetical protein